MSSSRSHDLTFLHLTTLRQIYKEYLLTQLTLFSQPFAQASVTVKVFAQAFRPSICNYQSFRPISPKLFAQASGTVKVFANFGHLLLFQSHNRNLLPIALTRSCVAVFCMNAQLTATPNMEHKDYRCYL